MDIVRCGWVTDDPLYQEYHDKVWGRPVYDAKELFAKLCLDGQQAGLSWLTILKKQANYERAFAGFDPQVIAGFDQAKIEELLQDPGIVRNRAKVNSIVRNAKAYLAFVEQGNDFSEFLWGFVCGVPKVNRFETLTQVPAQTPESEAMSKALKKLGFNFCGPTICYAFMQAVGMVNDHLLDCCCYPHD
ncbi:DNA-3-methyladenine glycosylase I [Shewanella algae]|uniref:DNA-3-methyladenine glycosylase I n=1 Tax=Shewanella algae TaxID=38313 RepID=UPI001184065C|nr:DNA-3-methyladenine glycosylase I [Shewanella algae]MBO2660460.1 DNA-3-methyladenine glycosylase I [Shewanella algae]MCL1055849.1 DNA-3-methyladenine glycosylase I [Shewanella algae]TVO84551.1 3-methyladenine DNA glycosylase [Shewanella algae]TXS84278.1 3-methyladenine DNA glycosylase [Shewanella algae]